MTVLESLGNYRYKLSFVGYFGLEVAWNTFRDVIEVASFLIKSFLQVLDYLWHKTNRNHLIMRD